MDILNSKKFKQNQIKDIVKPQPVVGNKEKHPTLLRGKIKQNNRWINNMILLVFSDPKPSSIPEKSLSETATDDLLFDQFRKNCHGSRNWKIRHA
jgi:hypothetical protein